MVRERSSFPVCVHLDTEAACSGTGTGPAWASCTCSSTRPTAKPVDSNSCYEYQGDRRGRAPPDRGLSGATPRDRTPSVRAPRPFGRQECQGYRVAIVATHLLETSAAARISTPAVAETIIPLIELGLATTCGTLDFEALYCARTTNEYEQIRDDRVYAYEYLPTDDQDWHRVFEVQRELARISRLHAVGLPDLLDFTQEGSAPHTRISRKPPEGVRVDDLVEFSAVDAENWPSLLNQLSASSGPFRRLRLSPLTLKRSSRFVNSNSGLPTRTPCKSPRSTRQAQRSMNWRSSSAAIGIPSASAKPTARPAAPGRTRARTTGIDAGRDPFGGRPGVTPQGQCRSRLVWSARSGSAWSGRASWVRRHTGRRPGLPAGM